MRLDIHVSFGTDTLWIAEILLSLLQVERLNPLTTCLLFFDCSRIFVNGPSLRAEDRNPMIQAAVKNWQRQQTLARQFRMMVVYANTAQRVDQSDYFPRLIDRFQPARP